ncbi:hypothetical protein F4604DRAFT_1206602 [Suillus subluteus]|nr:hypothetical protein F4604DRAFT_1206602 [Suillus subluteus]
MHRRVAQTAAAVLPHSASLEYPWDPDWAQPVEGPVTNAYADIGFPAMNSPVESIIASPNPQEDNVLNDEDDDDLEWELQNNGLYIGSYSRLLLLNAFVPIFAIVIFTVLALLPDLAWPIADFPSSYPSSFPFPLPEILISSAFFSLAHLLRIPLFSLASFLLPSESASLASTFIHVLITNGLRLAALVVLQVRHTMDYPAPTCQDPAFRTVWWLSLNFAEVLAAIVQGYEQLALYRDVMVPEGRETEFLERLKSGSLNESDPALENPHSPQQERETFENGLEDGEVRSVESRIDRGLEKLLVIKMRDELEEVYGVPVIKIPVFVSCLQRFNSIFLSIGLTSPPQRSIPPLPTLSPPLRRIRPIVIPPCNSPTQRFPPLIRGFTHAILRQLIHPIHHNHPPRPSPPRKPRSAAHTSPPTTCRRAYRCLCWCVGQYHDLFRGVGCLGGIVIGPSDLVSIFFLSCVWLIRAV